MSGVGAKTEVGYESVYEREMFAEALCKVGLLLPEG